MRRDVGDRCEVLQGVTAVLKMILSVSRSQWRRNTLRSAPTGVCRPVCHYNSRVDREPKQRLEDGRRDEMAMLRSWRNVTSYYKRSSQVVSYTWVTRLDRPVCWAIRSRSCPSGLLSTWKFVWRIRSCSSVNDVRTRFVFILWPEPSSPSIVSCRCHIQQQQYTTVFYWTQQPVEISKKVVAVCVLGVATYADKKPSCR